MGRQIRIYISEGDASVLCENVTSQQDVLILRNRSRGPFPQIVDTTDLIDGGERHYFFYFVRAADLENVVTTEVKEQGFWSVDELRSPVIEFIRSTVDDNAIHPGRLYYIEKYYDNAGKLTDKTSGFSEWARAVFKRVKKSLTYDKAIDAYLGDEALEMRKSGIVLRPF